MSKVLALLAMVFAAGAASAQDYPSRPVHLVVPYTPGTGADILARLIGPKLAERWNVAVVTDNRPGATGNIGADLVAKSAADGHHAALPRHFLRRQPGDDAAAVRSAEELRAGGAGRHQLARASSSIRLCRRARMREFVDSGKSAARASCTTARREAAACSTWRWS